MPKILISPRPAAVLHAHTDNQRPSSDMGIQVIPITQKWVGKAIGLLADVFHPSPILAYLYPDARQRAAANRIFFGYAINFYRTHGRVDIALCDGSLAGVVIWRKPEGMSLSLKDKAVTAAVQLRLLLRASRPYSEVIRGIRNFDLHHPREAHWYEMFIGVDPRFRKRDIGSNLLATVHRMADQKGHLCYTEISNKYLLKFYEKTGYKVTAHIKPYVNGPDMWSLTRSPAPGLQAKERSDVGRRCRDPQCST